MSSKPDDLEAGRSWWIRCSELGSYDGFRLNQLECERLRDAAAIDEYRFGLVNFRCEGNRATVVQRPGGTHYLRGLAVSLSVGDGRIGGTIVPVEESGYPAGAVCASGGPIPQLQVPGCAPRNQPQRTRKPGRTSGCHHPEIQQPVEARLPGSETRRFSKSPFAFVNFVPSL
jgi:hypothetical protein